MNKKGLEEKRNDLRQEMTDILNNSKKENRVMSEEEVARFDEIEKEINSIDATLERENKIEKMEEKSEKTEDESELTAAEKRMYTSVEERNDYNVLQSILEVKL